MCYLFNTGGCTAGEEEIRRGRLSSRFGESAEDSLEGLEGFRQGGKMIRFVLLKLITPTIYVSCDLMISSDNLRRKTTVATKCFTTSF